jgi:hypothetical protein
MTVNPEHFQILSDFKQRIGEVKGNSFLKFLIIEIYLEIKKT